MGRLPVTGQRTRPARIIVAYVATYPNLTHPAGETTQSSRLLLLLLLAAARVLLKGCNSARDDKPFMFFVPCAPRVQNLSEREQHAQGSRPACV